MSLGWPGDMEPMDVHFTKGQKKFLADLQEKRHLEECAAAREHQGCGVVTDEMVGAAAKAWYERETGFSWLLDASLTTKEFYRRQARAALGAAFRVKGGTDQ